MDTSDEALREASIPRFELPDRLRKSLEHAGVTTAEMAQYLEVHRNTVSNWIYGHARPPASAVKLWSMRCGVPYEWVAHGIAPGETPPAPRSVPQRSLYGADLDRHVEPRSNTEAILALRKRIPTSRSLTGQAVR